MKATRRGFIAGICGAVALAVAPLYGMKREAPRSNPMRDVFLEDQALHSVRIQWRHTTANTTWTEHHRIEHYEESLSFVDDR